MPIDHNARRPNDLHAEKLCDALWMTQIVGAWRVGTVMDIKATQAPFFEGGPVETGNRVTVNVGVRWVGWRELRRLYTCNPKGPQVCGAFTTEWTEIVQGSLYDPAEAAKRVGAAALEVPDRAVAADGNGAMVEYNFDGKSVPKGTDDLLYFQWPAKPELKNTLSRPATGLTGKPIQGPVFDRPRDDASGLRVAQDEYIGLKRKRGRNDSDFDATTAKQKKVAAAIENVEKKIRDVDLALLAPINDQDKRAKERQLANLKKQLEKLKKQAADLKQEAEDKRVVDVTERVAEARGVASAADGEHTAALEALLANVEALGASVDALHAEMAAAARGARVAARPRAAAVGRGRRAGRRRATGDGGGAGAGGGGAGAEEGARRPRRRWRRARWSGRACACSAWSAWSAERAEPRLARALAGASPMPAGAALRRPRPSRRPRRRWWPAPAPSRPRARPAARAPTCCASPVDAVAVARPVGRAGRRGRADGDGGRRQRERHRRRDGGRRGAGGAQAEEDARAPDVGRLLVHFWGWEHGRGRLAPGAAESGAPRRGKVSAP